MEEVAGKGGWVVRGSLEVVGMGPAPKDDRPEHSSHSRSISSVSGFNPCPGLGVDFHVALLCLRRTTVQREPGAWGPLLAAFQDFGKVTKRAAIPEAPWRRRCGGK